MVRGAVAVIEKISAAFAFAGGLVLIAISAMTVTSVVGRKLFGNAITGDFELVEIGCAVAIALFLPYCQLKRGNVIVDFFTLRAPPSLKRLLDVFGCLLLSAIAMLMTWRLGAGGISLFTSNDQTMVLQVGTWWPFLILVPCMALLSLVGLLTAWWALTGAWDEDLATVEGAGR